MPFEKIIGNNKIKKLLQEAISTRHFLHSYLFVGENGIGKKMFAKEFAKEILYAKDSKESSYEQFDNNNHPDFTIINPDGNSIKIEQIRILQNKIMEKPILSNKKVYIIDDCEYMTKEAQNCLLKTLEEPPEYAVIILICSNENLLLNTIKSRCTKIVFQNLSKEELEKYIKEQNLFSSINNTILEAMGGSIGKAYGIKEKEDLYKQIEEIFLNIEKFDKIDIVQKSTNLYKAKDDIQNVLDYINIILFKKIKENNNFLNCAKIIENAKIRLKQNANFDMTIDDMLFHLWEEIHEKYNRSSF